MSEREASCRPSESTPHAGFAEKSVHRVPAQSTVSSRLIEVSAERDFDDLACITAQICAAPVAMIVIADGGCQWVKAATGLKREEAPLHWSPLDQTLLRRAPVLVGDTVTEESAQSDLPSPASVEWRAYAGVPLMTPQGSVVGTLCVLDIRPRQWPAVVPETLQSLARQVVAQIELRRLTDELSRKGEALERSVREGERAEQALSESEGRFHSMADSVPVMIWTAGPYATPTFFNHSWLKFIGQSLAQALKGGWRESVHPEDLPGYLDAYVSAFKAQREFRSAYRLRRADGEYRWVEDAGVPWFVSGGVFAGYVGAAIDVTERRRHEEQVESMNRVLEERVNERTAELRAVNRELEDFAHSISHDLRAPLRAITGFSKILLDSHAAGLSAEAQRCLKLVRSGADQMQQLINDLLEFARYSRLPLLRRKMKLESVAESAIAELERQHPERRLVFRVSAMPECLGDPALLRQVLFNLLENSVKFTRPCATPVIEIGWQPSATSDGQTVYFVRDNGVGFEMRYAHKLFGVFQRLHRADEYEGTGVGLSIVQRIIERHGGAIWAQAEPGNGATFFFTIPQAGKSNEGNSNDGPPARSKDGVSPNVGI